ncbi:hypothetical protein TNCV_4853751 [Trichonephila clavipes]|nr:hypothetical protein TNCV_4853751 [Trichonephila clavipes]
MESSRSCCCDVFQSPLLETEAETLNFLTETKKDISFYEITISALTFFFWFLTSYRGPQVTGKKGATVKSNTTPNHDTRCRTSVAVHNAIVQIPLTTVSPNSNSTIVMLQAEAQFVSKHIVPFRCPLPPFIAQLAAQAPAVSSQE